MPDSEVLQLVIERNGSCGLMTSGLVLPPASDIDEQKAWVLQGISSLPMLPHDG